MRVPRRWLDVARVAIVSPIVLWGHPADAGRADASSTVGGQDADARRAARDAGCLLFTAGARASRSADCLACHGPGASAGQRRSCHPVGIDYANASRLRSSLRQIDEVVRRGLFLPDHEIRCVTCHDERSQWAFAVALPPGATPRLEVDAADRRTQRRDPPPPMPGDRVSPAPLCLACHLLGGSSSYRSEPMGPESTYGALSDANASYAMRTAEVHRHASSQGYAFQRISQTQVRSPRLRQLTSFEETSWAPAMMSIRS